MQKIIFSIIFVGANTVFANNLDSFQKFDNQFNVGYGVTMGNIVNGSNNQALVGTNYLQLDVERLFDNGIWFDLSAGLMTYSTNYNSIAPGTAPGLIGQNPNIANLNTKVGYAFPLVTDIVKITPYALIGRNTNLTANTLVNTTTIDPATGVGTTPNITQDYFYTTGLGGRLEYRINDKFSTYFDQSIAYNFDQSTSGNVYSGANSSNWMFTSSANIKYNVTKQLQFGLNGFYSYQMASGSMPSNQYQLQQNLGGLISVGITY